MAEKPDQPSASDSDTEPLFKLFTIVEAKNSYSYVVPSFPVFAVNLRHIKYQMTDENGQVQTFDGFIRECPSLKRSYPAIVRVEIGSKFAFLVKVNSSAVHGPLAPLSPGPSTKRLAASWTYHYFTCTKC